MRLTARNVAALELPTGKVDHIVFDDDVPGFGLRVRDSGTRTWIYQYKIGSKQRRLVLGKASALTAEKARGLAADLHAKVRLGGDPAADKAVGKANAALSFKAIADRFLAWEKGRLRPRSYVEVERHILKHARQLHGMPIPTIDQRVIAARIGSLVDTAGPTTAHLVRSSLSSLFAWSMREGLINQNPVLNTNAPPQAARDRVLRDSELWQIWHACDDDDYGTIVRLLALTGQRRNEISELRWSEIEDGVIELPPSRTKNKRPHQVPVSGAVADILATRLRREGRDLIFGTGDRPFTSWHLAKQQLDERIAAAGGKPLPHWTHHDLRRTCATRMADLGILPHVIEAVLNHLSGHKAGIAGIYNRATYAAEKAQALAVWGDHVSAIVENRESNAPASKQA